MLLFARENSEKDGEALQRSWLGHRRLNKDFHLLANKKPWQTGGVTLIDHLQHSRINSLGVVARE
jgi:hypothetical protein